MEIYRLRKKYASVRVAIERRDIDNTVYIKREGKKKEKEFK